MEGYQRIQEDGQEETNFHNSSLRLSLDGHLENLQQLTWSMNGIVNSGTEPSNDVISNEEATRENTTVQNDTHPVLGDDMVTSSSNQLLQPVYTMGLSTPVEVGLPMEEDYYDDRITSLQQQGLISIGTEPISIPTEKENTIIQILTPVTSGVNELELCFCGAPYTDTGSKIKHDSHEAVKMPECPHIFGKRCIVQWLSENQVPTCPMCRKKVILVRDVPVEWMDDEELYRVVDYYFLAI